MAYKFSKNTYRNTVKKDISDKIEVEIGDSKQDDFKPQFKVMRWNGEVNFSMRAEEKENAILEKNGDTIKYITEDYEVHQYEKDVDEDGGFEFEWILNKKPTSNVLIATIETKGLNFFYQPELTQKEKDEGGERPENTIGSYAVYHKTKQGNFTGGQHYKTGKFCHIYRPQAFDADGNKTWCELHIDKDLQVTVPQEFLDNAKYPVTVDPTFGYTSVGSVGFSTNYWNYFGSEFEITENGTITTLSSYMEDSDATGHSFVSCVYNTDGNANPHPTTLEANSSTRDDIGSTASWEDFNVSLILSSNDKRYLTIWNERDTGDTGLIIYGDNSGYTNKGFIAYNTGTSPESNLTSSSHYFNKDYKLSAYATYTTSSSGYTLTADTVAFTITGIATSLLHNFLLSADKATFTITGIDTTISRGYNLALDTANFTLTGIDTLLAITRKLTATTTAFTLTGFDTAFSFTRRIVLETASFILDGKAVALIYNNLVNYILTADVGEFIQTGYETSLKVTRKIALETTSFSIVGKTVNLIRKFVLSLDTGIFTLTGFNGIIHASRRIIATVREFTVTGNDATFRERTGGSGITIFGIKL